MKQLQANTDSYRWPKGVSQPAQRALAAAGFLRLEQLNGKSESELAQLHGMGPKALRILSAALKEHSMALAK